MFIIENWPGHLTPGEANSLADRGSRSENPVVQNLAARLALSCLTYADKLTSHEIIQAINQVGISLIPRTGNCYGALFVMRMLPVPESGARYAGESLL